jgi:hypothetical protein
MAAMQKHCMAAILFAREILCAQLARSMPNSSTASTVKLIAT